MIVAKINNDEDVKLWLVVFVFHASVTQQRSSSSKTRISCSHVHERINSCCPPCKQGFEKKGATQTDAENLVDAVAQRETEKHSMSSPSFLRDVTQNKIKLRSLSTRLRSACQVVRMLLQNIGLELSSQTPIQSVVTLESVLARIHKTK